MPRSSIQRFAFLLCILLLTSKAYAQVTADFIPSDTAFCAPNVIFFTNTSTGATSYSWDLGNGVLSSGTNASTSYTSVGSYTVTLTASDGIHTSTKKIPIVAYGLPTIAFSASSTTACINSPINFTSTSVPNMWGSLDYIWNFGDGTSTTLASPTISYLTAGYYNITLLARNKGKCANSLTKGTYIYIPSAVKADFDAPTTHFCSAPGTATFTNLTTGTSPFTYKWFFGDGGTSTAPTPSHTYTAVGDYTVKLVATDANGCTDTMSKIAFISVVRFKAAFTSPPQSCYNVPIQLVDTGSGARLTRTWDFGDGDIFSVNASDSVTYTYPRGSIYSIKLTVYDGFCSDSLKRTIQINQPIGDYTISRPCSPTSTLGYSATTSSPFINISWLFDDTAHGAGYNLTHTFTKGGVPNYSYCPVKSKMIMTDPNGCVDSLERQDTVYNLYYDLRGSEAPSTSEMDGCAPLTVNFHADPTALLLCQPGFPGSTMLPYNYPTASCTWNFGDGTPILTSSSANPVHVFTDTGVFVVHCHLVTSNGCMMDTITTVKVGSRQTADFTVSPAHACRNTTYTFTSTTTSTLIDNYDWSFDEGGGRKGMVPTVMYEPQSSGNLTALLYVYFKGCRSLPIQHAYKVDAPTSVIVHNLLCDPPNGVAFGDSSIGDDSRVWDFGDGTTSTLKNPVHYFPALTNYAIKLSTASFSTSCLDTQTIYINLERLSTTCKLRAFTGKLCINTKDTITNVIKNILAGPHNTLYSMPLQETWYDNGVPIDTGTPIFYIPFDSEDMTDTTFETFLSRGLHKIDVVMVNNFGCLDTISNTIVVAKPHAKFSATFTNGCAPIVATFVDSSDAIPQVPINLHRWDFGDGGVFYDVGIHANHNYDTNGHFVISEIVTDTLGCMDTSFSNVNPVISKPRARFSVSDSTNCLHTNISFNNLSTPPTSLNWLWSFGDGATSTLRTPIYDYPLPGTYNVSLVAIDTFGCTDTMNISNFMTIRPTPVAMFTMDDSFAICPPLSVNFSNFSTGSVAFDWSLGDGNFSQVANPSDIYSLPGSYAVRLTASNGFGCIDTMVRHAVVFGFNGAFSYSPVTHCIGTPVAFKSLTTGAASMVWDFNDGTTSSLTVADTISHVYPVTGAYIPKLILKDSSGCSAFSYGVDTIKVDSLTPDFSFVPATGCQNAAMTFTDASHSLFSHSSAWTWTFGPGATSTIKSPAYTFTVSGTLPVTLAVADSAGCSSSVTKNITVNPAPASISGTPVVCVGATSQLSDATSGGTWASSNTSIAAINYSGTLSGNGAGTATVTYTLSTGCSITTPVTVNPLPLAITGNAGVCVGATTALSDKTAGGTWTSSNTNLATVGSAGTVTGISDGTLTISYTTPSGCGALTGVTVLPLPGAVKGTLYVCNGQVTPLSDSVTGGLWTSTGTTIARIGSLSGSVTGLSPGTSTISYKLGTGCAVTAIVTVNPVPATIPAATAVCAGAANTLSNTTTGGTWTSANTMVATIDPTSGVYTGVGGGTATISYILSTGCSAQRIVTINTLPGRIRGDSSVCLGYTITLSDSITGGVWRSGNTAVATISSPAILTGKAAGTATISYTLPTGCMASSNVTVNIAPAAITGITQVCAGNANTLSDAVTGGNWTSGDTNIATIGGGSGTYTGVSVGTTVITYTPGAGCNATDTITVLLQPGPVKGPSAVCYNASIALSDSVTGGVWSTGATVLAITSSGFSTGIRPGTATVTYTLGSCFSTSVITINPVPDGILAIKPVCVNNTVTLSDDVTGGVWTSGTSAIATADSFTGVITGVAAGTASITYTLPTGCSTSSPVTVNPLPLTINGPDSVCVASSITLSDASAEGTWTSANTSIVSVGFTGVVSGLMAGTAVVTYTLPTGCGTTTVVKVNPLPSAISGIATVCKGLTTTLSDSDPSGTWTAFATTIATVDISSGMLTGVNAGTAAITYTLPTGCRTQTTATVYPLPVPITGILEVCAGLTTTLSDASPGGTWSSRNTSIAFIGASSGIVTGNVAGTDTITYTLGTGCIITASMLVDPLPSPIHVPGHVCEAGSVTLTDPDGPGTWSSASTLVSILSSGLVTAHSAGTAIISYTLPTGCMDTAIVTMDPLPAPITGITSVCRGSSTTFSDASPGGAWSTNDTASVIDPLTGVAIGINPMNGTITYTLPTGCLDTIVIVVNDTPSAITGVMTLCKDGYTKLSEALPVGLWFSDDPLIAYVDRTTGDVSGITPGTAVIHFVGTGGCAATTTVTVYPLIAPITGKTTFCSGDSTNLSDGMSGGTWISSDTSIVIVSATGKVNGLKAGIATISYSATPACGSATAYIDVKQSPYAGIIHGPDNICEGASVQLIDTVPLGAWGSNNHRITSVSAGGLLTGLAPGTDTVWYSYANACGTDKAVLAVTVNQTPAHVAITTRPLPGALCDNTLFANFGAEAPPATGIRYYWTASNAVVYATGSNQQYCLVNFPYPGPAVVRLTTSAATGACGGYDSVAYSVSATEQPEPTVVYYSPQFICRDNTAQSFQWGYDDVSTLDSTILNGMVNQDFYEPLPDFVHKYYWVLTTHDGCVIKSYYNRPLGVHAAAIDAITAELYPNPADDIVTISLKGLKAGQKAEARITDMIGKQRRMATLDKGKADVSVKDLPPGVYTVTFFIDNIKITAKQLVKE